MVNEQKSISVETLDKLHTSGAGYDVLRYVGLPDLFGTESDTLLYFMGKNLARKLETRTIDDIVFFFDKMGWGKLDLYKEKKKGMTFHLMADAVVYRLNAPIDAEFRLEAGFLAEAVQIIKGRQSECQESINQKLAQIEFSVMYID
ncbi:YslB family protein [Virgibacillus kekensis]|uniref:YslB family protein n=1 Tax=Virgibacillus kekensis TaxID=202261 RepID=A0ABV9DEC1_9BACI